MRLISITRINCPIRRLPVAAIHRFCASRLIVVDHNFEAIEASNEAAGLIEVSHTGFMAYDQYTVAR